MPGNLAMELDLSYLLFWHIYRPVDNGKVVGFSVEIFFR